MIQERVGAGPPRAGRSPNDVAAAIRAALRKKDRPGVRVIAAKHGVSVNTHTAGYETDKMCQRVEQL